MTAYKPYTVTKYRFQLLDNLQENDFPADVPSEFSQTGKDYRCVVRVGSARVKGERQVTKDIGNTHFHNANFNNPDTKNNLTILVIVKGQALTSKSNCIKTQSSKSSHRKDHTVLIIGDSHTRLCAINVKSEIKDNYDVSRTGETRCRSRYISEHSQQWYHKLNKKRCNFLWRCLQKTTLKRPWGISEILSNQIIILILS